MNKNLLLQAYSIMGQKRFQNIINNAKRQARVIEMKRKMIGVPKTPHTRVSAKGSWGTPKRMRLNNNKR
jgi:hypothetical protein